MSDNFYRAFEDKHRGSRELIKSRLEIYLPFIEKIKEIQPKPKTIDLGCGRGEWLELLSENDCEAQGIDLDEGMLQACTQRGFNVKRQDAIEALRNLDDASISVVSGFHIVEHLPFEVLQTLVQESLRVLKPGGILIMETPNPENIKVATENFYLDPTHIKPIPSALLTFLPEFYGYNRTKVLRLQESKEIEKEISELDRALITLDSILERKASELMKIQIEKARFEENTTNYKNELTRSKKAEKLKTLLSKQIPTIFLELYMIYVKDEANIFLEDTGRYSLDLPKINYDEDTKRNTFIIPISSGYARPQSKNSFVIFVFEMRPSTL